MHMSWILIFIRLTTCSDHRLQLIITKYGEKTKRNVQTDHYLPLVLCLYSFQTVQLSTCALFPPIPTIWVTVLRNGPIALRVVLLHLRNASRQRSLAFVSHQLELLAADRGILRLFVSPSPGNLPFSTYNSTCYLSVKVVSNREQAIVGLIMFVSSRASFFLIPQKQRVDVLSRLPLVWN